jgi:hypothetical protein
MAAIPKYIGNPVQTGRSCYHGFTKNSNGDLLYIRVTSGEFPLKDGNGNQLYVEQYIGTDDGTYSINSNGQLIYTFRENPQ